MYESFPGKTKIKAKTKLIIIICCHIFISVLQCYIAAIFCWRVKPPLACGQNLNSWRNILLLDNPSSLFFMQQKKLLWFFLLPLTKFYSWFSRPNFVCYNFEVTKLNQIKSNLTIRKYPQKMTRTASFGLGIPQRMFLVLFPIFSKLIQS